jgi:hypothetical protein
VELQLERLKTKHQADHFARPWEVEQVRLALAAIDDGLNVLSRLGHPYHLVAGPSPVEDEWPKVMFHVEAAPNGRIVNSLYDAQELGPEWFYTLQEAQHAEGIRAQFAGRGGVGSRSVPMMPGVVGVQPERPLTPKDNSAAIEAWKKENGNGSKRS